MKVEQTECTEMLAHKIQTPGNYPEESIQLSGHGESLKSRKIKHISFFFLNWFFFSGRLQCYNSFMKTLFYKS
jgi:hypothetical protein